MSFNLCVFEGNLTRDVDAKFTTDGKAIAKFTIAVNRNKEEADFVYVEAWEKQAELAMEYLKKGSKVLVQCRYKQDSYEKDGKKQSTHKFVASVIRLLDKRQEE